MLLEMLQLILNDCVWINIYKNLDVIVILLWGWVRILSETKEN